MGSLCKVPKQVGEMHALLFNKINVNIMRNFAFQVNVFVVVVAAVSKCYAHLKYQ